MNVLAADKKLTTVNALVEGTSIRSSERMTGVHQTLRMTPAMSANLTDHLWTLE